MPVVHRRAPHWRKVLADFLGCERAKGDRRKRRAESGRPDLGNAPASQTAHDGESVHVAGSPLIGAHAQCRIAFQVLDREVSLAGGEADVISGYVILKVDETLTVLIRW